MVVPVVSNDTVSSRLPTDLPIIALSQSEVATARSRFKVSCASFRVVLIGKDGSPKLSSNDLVSFDKLSALIDAMPMRKQEIKQRPQRGGQ